MSAAALSRRSLLASFSAIAAAAAPVPALALVEAPTQPVAIPAPDPVLAEIGATEKAHRASVRAVKKLHSEVRKAEQANGARPDTVIDESPGYCMSADPKPDRRKRKVNMWLYEAGELVPDGPGSERMIPYEECGESARTIELRARMRAAIDEAEAWEERTGVAKFRRRKEEKREAHWAAWERLAETSPTTPAGAGALAEYVISDSENFSAADWWHWQALENATTALKEMTAAA
jgi:hypothetical protein